MILTKEHEAIIRLFLSDEIAENFAVKEITQGKDRIDIRLEEHPTLIPKDMGINKDDVVLDGFCNELELQTFVINERAVFLHIYRRRWKRKGSDTHVSNSYDFHPPGVKATHSFAAFLKEEYGFTPEQHYAYIQSLWANEQKRQ
jgi:hypothetical protein